MLEKPYIFIFLLILISSSPLKADDFDGDIPVDEPAIDDSLKLGINIQFIKRNVIAKARRGSKDANVDCGGAGNQTFGPGANLQGATIVNLSDNRGASAVCTK